MLETSLVWLARPSHLTARAAQSAPSIRWDGLASQTRDALCFSCYFLPLSAKTRVEMPEMVADN